MRSYRSVSSVGPRWQRLVKLLKAVRYGYKASILSSYQILGVL